MTTTATALLARSLSAGLRVTLNGSRLVVRGFAALQPLVDEVKSHRAEIIALLAEAKKLFHETRDAGNVVFAIGTDRVSAATSIAGDLRERLRLAKVGVIAVLRAETPVATQALNDLTGQALQSPSEDQSHVCVSPEYRVQQPDLPDDVLYVSQALRLRWESHADPFADAHWWRTFETNEAARTLHCYYRVTPAVFASHLVMWAHLKDRQRMLEWQLTGDVLLDDRRRTRLATEKARIDTIIAAIDNALHDMKTYLTARFPDFKLDEVIPKLPADPIYIQCPFECDPPAVAVTPNWFDDCEQIDFNLDDVEGLPSDATLSAVSPASEFESVGNGLPAGKYVAFPQQILNLLGNKTPLLDFIFVVRFGQYKGRQHRERLYVTENAMPRVLLFAKRFGLLGEADCGGSQVRRSWAAAIGKEVVIEIVESEYFSKNGTKGRNSKMTYRGIWNTDDPLVADVVAAVRGGAVTSTLKPSSVGKKPRVPGGPS